MVSRILYIIPGLIQSRTQPSGLKAHSRGRTNERSVSLEHSHVETVTMAVPDEHVSCVGDVDTVRVVCDRVGPNTPLELSVVIEYNHTVAL